MVPSGAMGRDIPVAFLHGGPHAVYLLDAFNAGFLYAWMRGKTPVSGRWRCSSAA